MHETQVGMQKMHLQLGTRGDLGTTFGFQREVFPGKCFGRES